MYVDNSDIPNITRKKIKIAMAKYLIFYPFKSKIQEFHFHLPNQPIHCYMAELLQGF